MVSAPCTINLSVSRNFGRVDEEHAILFDLSRTSPAGLRPAVHVPRNRAEDFASAPAGIAERLFEIIFPKGERP